MLTERKHTFDKELQSSWYVTASDNRYIYPPKPEGNSEYDYDIAEWKSVCLQIAGLNWYEQHGEAGQYFAQEPIVYFRRHRIIFEQYRGYDV